MKHVVHCSGYSLAERIDASNVRDANGHQIQGRFYDWDLVSLGDPNHRLLGRVPMALLVAERLKADRIIWSTGATFASEVSEADAAMSEALKYLTKGGKNSDWLKRISIFERESTNTLSSMEVAAEIIRKLFRDSEIMLHLVTSANHAPRLARDAAIAFRDRRNVILSVIPCHTSYGGGDIVNVVIKDLSGNSIA